MTNTDNGQVIQGDTEDFMYHFTVCRKSFVLNEKYAIHRKEKIVMIINMLIGRGHYYHEIKVIKSLVINVATFSQV